jgi:hypothetical protein
MHAAAVPCFAGMHRALLGAEDIFDVFMASQDEYFTGFEGNYAYLGHSLGTTYGLRIYAGQTYRIKIRVAGASVGGQSMGTQLISRV